MIHLKLKSKFARENNKFRVVSGERISLSDTGVQELTEAAARIALGIRENDEQIFEFADPTEAANRLPAGFPFTEELNAGGFYLIEEIAAATDEGILAVPGIGKNKLAQIRAFAPENQGEAE